MSHTRPLALALVAALACSDPPGPPVTSEPPDGYGPPPPLALRRAAFEEVAGGFDLPLYLTAPAGDPRLFVVERRGKIKVVRDGVTLPAPFLDLGAEISTSGSERGMLSMAFHPAFAANGLVFVSYTATNGDVVVTRYRVDPGAPDRADPGSARTVIRIDHPGSTHNGGQLAFGADGMLYLTVGDGGSGGDPERDAQSLGSLLGKVLRLDVDRGSPYAIPADNPFAGRAGARPEIWATGLRNPWRMSFDAAADLLIVADVGQNHWEEVNVVPARTGGLNFGWNVVEGTHCFARTPCDAAEFTTPALEYEHAPPCTSVIGGYVYRGTRLPGHAGRYFFADYCLGWIRSIRVDGRDIAEYAEWVDPPPGRVQSFGLDGAGELYVLLAGGSILRLGAEH